MENKEIATKMVEVSSYLYDKALVPGKSGNISIKFKKNGLEQVAVTPSGLSLKSLVENDILIVAMDGTLLYDVDNKKPTSELLMHLNIYRERNDVNAIIHTHSPIATGFAFAEEKIGRLEGFGPIKNEFIPFIDYKPPGSVELADAVSIGLKNEDMVVLKRHGVVAVGENLDDAALLAEFIEESAKIQLVSCLLVANRF